MTIKYLTAPPDEDGIYLVRVNGELTVAEATVDRFAKEGYWNQIGSDYDVWRYSSVEYQIEVIACLKLDKLAAILLLANQVANTMIGEGAHYRAVFELREALQKPD